MNAELGNWHATSNTSPNAGGTPIGFKGDGTAEHLLQAGTVSGKIMVKHPAGVPKYVLDEAPEGESGTARTEGKIEGLSWFD